MQELQQSIEVGGQEFIFNLNYKTIAMSDLTLDYFWLPIPTLYGQRTTKIPLSDNFKSLIECFWTISKKMDALALPDTCDIYLQAGICPLVRNQGSRRIVADARLAPPSEKRSPQRKGWLKTLDEVIANTKHKELDLVQFRDKTADFMGPGLFSAEIRSRYDEIEGDLFGQARKLVECRMDKALEMVKDRWQQYSRKYGRRSGNPIEKQVLDILSYESRAAVHRCYSAVWHHLIPHLTQVAELRPPSTNFLQLWHLEQIMPSVERVDVNFHLFHGHVFALHPATTDFVQTPVGQDLLCAWLLDPKAKSTFQRLLHGIWTSVVQYAINREDTSQARKKFPFNSAPDYLAEWSEATERKKSGKRRRKHISQDEQNDSQD